MLMRVSVGIHKEDITAAIETYNLLSEKWFTHASPTLFNAGTNRPQLSRWTYSDQTQEGSILWHNRLVHCVWYLSCFCLMSSCFLLAMKDDSIDGIYDTLKQCALISKSAGGIGVAVSCIRATGSYIAGVSFSDNFRCVQWKWFVFTVYLIFVIRLMATQMAWFQCFVSTTTQPAMWTKEEIR